MISLLIWGPYTAANSPHLLFLQAILGSMFSGWLLYWIDLLVRYELLTLEFNLFQHHKFPWEQSSWGQHGAHLGPTGPRRAPCWPHELCYLGYVTIFLKGKIYLTAKYEMFQRYPTGHISYNYKKSYKLRFISNHSDIHKYKISAKGKYLYKSINGNKLMHWKFSCWHWWNYFLAKGSY